jgi:hypothetical protein
MSCSSRALATLVAAALFVFTFPASSPAVDGPTSATAASAVAWLKSQQLPDGGFEVVGFPGFETRDASLAIAEQAQTGSMWSTSQAYDALANLHQHDTGKTPLDALDAYAAGITSAGDAAKTIVLTASPLGLNPAAFDAANDGAPVPLASKLDSGCGANTASFGTFSDTLYAVMAKKLVCGAAPSNAITAIRDAQQSDGGWNFVGDPTQTGADPDETGLALMALAAGGVAPDDHTVRAGLALLAGSQQASGAWIDFFGTEGNPSSTALAVLGISAFGYDPQSSCWRDTVASSLATSHYADPVAWIRSQQQPDGHILSPYDTFGVNTLTTSQSVEGLLRSWLPIARGAPQTCPLPPPSIDTTTPTAGGTLAVSGGGFASHTPLTIELHSTPVVLGDAMSDDGGSYSTTVVIPAGTVAGAHEIVVTGLGPSGEVRTSSVTITVTATETVSPPNAVVIVPSFTG